MTPLISFYKDLLESLGCEITEQGVICYATTAEKEELQPIQVKVGKKNKTLVLPTKANLKDGNWDEMVAFHPTCESIVAGQSEVLNVLCNLIAVRLHDLILVLTLNILQLAVNTEVHGRLSLGQQEMLHQFDGINDNTIKLFGSIMSKSTGISGKYPFISLRLERGGEIDNEVFNRTCAVIPHMLNHDKTICGVVPQSEKIKKVLKSVFNFLLPPVLKYGSNSKDMPYLKALLSAYFGMATHLNYIRSLLGKEGTTVPIPLNWYEHVNELSKLFKQCLPQPLPGNKGMIINPIRHQAEEVNAENVTPTAEESVAAVKPVEGEKSSHLSRLGLIKPAALPQTSAPEPAVAHYAAQPVYAQPVVQAQPVAAVYPPQPQPGFLPYGQPAAPVAPTTQLSMMANYLTQSQQHSHAPQQIGHNRPSFNSPSQQFYAPQPMGYQQPHIQPQAQPYGVNSDQSPYPYQYPMNQQGYGLR